MKQYEQPKDIKDIPISDPVSCFTITYAKKPPFMIRKIEFGDELYNANSAKEQEEMLEMFELHGLLKIVKEFRKERFNMFIDMVRKA